MKHSAVYVFDVDGVLCEIGQSMEPGCVSRLARLLNEGAYVAVNTGRAYDRIGPELVEPIKKDLEDQDYMKRLIVATEMGGQITTFDDSGEHTVLTEYSISPELIAKAKAVFDNREAYSTMYWYGAKQTMATTVMSADADKDEYLVQQRAMLHELHEVFKDDNVTIATTIESIDVYAPNAGKHAGAELIYKWLEEQGVVGHDDFICFGDSHSDYEMARFFASKGAKTRFVYTGTGLQLSDPHSGVEVIDTPETHTAGTIKYLDSLA